MCVCVFLCARVCVLTDHTHHPTNRSPSAIGNMLLQSSADTLAHADRVRLDRTATNPGCDDDMWCGVGLRPEAIRTEIVPGQPHMKYSERNESQRNGRARRRHVIDMNVRA